MTAAQRFFPPTQTSSPVQFATAGGQAVVTFDPTAAYVDVTAPQHADLLVQKGWTKLPMLFGATADRPSAYGAYGVHPGSGYYDTTLDKPIFWDGAAWRDVTGNVV